MARRRRGTRRRKRNFVAIPFSATITLGTLGSTIVVAEDALGAALGEDIYMISVKANYTLLGHTATEGPIHVGFAHDDLSVTEIGEALDAELTDPDDIIQRERARRPVRRVGSFPCLSTNEALNDGVEVKTPLKFSVGDGHNLSCWARSYHASNLTTGSKVKIDGTIFGRWQR